MEKTGGMSDSIQGRVLKCDSNRFVVDVSGNRIFCSARKKVKETGIVPGDFVLTGLEDGETVITKVLPRKNSLVRPRVANVDQIIAVVALIPKPDYLMIDKLIVNANKQGISVVLCLNKSDLSKELTDELHAQYDGIVDHTVITSAKTNDISQLLPLLQDKLSCFAGQSAVGKSSLVNKLLGKVVQKTDSVSAKAQRGKNTTTRAEIIMLSDSSYVIDTPGFSMLDLHGMDKREFDLYYPEYVEASQKCKYHRCTHTAEPGCRVRELVQLGKLNRLRYERYLILHSELQKTQSAVYKSHNRK